MMKDVCDMTTIELYDLRKKAFTDGNDEDGINAHYELLRRMSYNPKNKRWDG